MKEAQQQEEPRPHCTRIRSDSRGKWSVATICYTCCYFNLHQFGWNRFTMVYYSYLDRLTCLKLNCVVVWWLTVSLKFLTSVFVPCCTDLHTFCANGILQLSSLTFLNKTETKSNTIVLLLIAWAPPVSMDDFKQSMVCAAQYSKTLYIVGVEACTNSLIWTRFN